MISLKDEILSAIRPSIRTLPKLVAQSVKKNAEIVILHVDKGNATLVLDSRDYNVKITTLVKDRSCILLVQDSCTEIEHHPLNRPPVSKEIQVRHCKGVQSLSCLWSLQLIFKAFRFN